MSKYDLLNGTCLPTAIAVEVGQLLGNPDKYRYATPQNLLAICEDYARQTRVCRNCGRLNHIREYCECTTAPELMETENE